MKFLSVVLTFFLSALFSFSQVAGFPGLESVSEEEKTPSVENGSDVVPKGQRFDGAKQYTFDNIPVVTTGFDKFVCNPDGILSSQSEAVIKSMLQQLEDSTTIQVLVVVVEQISHCDLFHFGVHLFNKYGIGEKEYNNGLVIVMSTNCRDVQFITGAGLEGIMPDIVCKNIQEEAMVPYLHDDLWDEGMVHGVSAVCDHLTGKANYTPIDNGEKEIQTYIFMFLMFLFYYLVGSYKRVSDYVFRDKCANCNARLKFVCDYHININNVKYVRREYLCPQCNKKTFKDIKLSAYSGYGMSSSGGGSRGSSRGFGGGHSRGGGSHSRF